MRRVLGTPRLRRALAGTAVVMAALPAPGAGETPAQAVELLNQQRLANGIPGVRLDTALSDGCAAHNAYMALHGMGHGQVRGRPGWTPHGAMEAPGTRASEVLSSGSDGWDARWASPWGDAPLHLAGMFHPAFTTAGYARSDRFICMRLQSPGPAPAGVYTLPGPNATGVPTRIDASSERPYSPADVVGVDDTRTGFNIIIWRVGGTDALRSASVHTPQGPVEVRLIDRTTPVPGGGTWRWMASMIVPVRPLAPDTTHTVTIVFGDGTRHRYAFSTGATVAAGQAAPPIVILRRGVDRLRWTLVGPVRVRTARVIWQRPGHTHRATARITRRVLTTATPPTPGRYRVRIVVGGRSLSLPGPVDVR